MYGAPLHLAIVVYGAVTHDCGTDNSVMQRSKLISAPLEGVGMSMPDHLIVYTRRPCSTSSLRALTHSENRRAGDRPDQCLQGHPGEYRLLNTNTPTIAMMVLGKGSEVVLVSSVS